MIIPDHIGDDLERKREEEKQMEYLRFTLCCGIAWPDFRGAFQILPEKEQERLKNVAWRLWVTRQLRYEIRTQTRDPTIGHDERYRFKHVEWPTLEVYLLVSCLDTLAGKPDYQDFGAWLSDQSEYTDLDTGQVQGLYSLYREDHGPRKTLGQLFLDLPSDVKDWISNNVVIKRSNRLLKTDDISQDADRLVKRLFDYYYDVCRNKFTHGSVSRQIRRAEDISFSNTNDSWSCSQWYHGSDGREWALCLRKGLDEATILRVIIQAATLQKMKLPVNVQIIDKFLAAQGCVNALYGFLDEIERNAVEVSWWPHFDPGQKGGYNSLIGMGGVQRLKTQWTSNLLEREMGKLFNKFVCQLVKQCWKATNHLNSAIEDFHTHHPPLGNVKASQNEWDDLLTNIKVFLAGLSETEDARFVVQTPRRREIFWIWKIIRSPCEE